ncbi:MAG TPA: mechanosensitive ion channel family protein [Solirubrobacteraceae bacterium]|jgi:small-conductance mechanosensitive channel|nr:mechanosensitive ion channel family protein [Solirubrobacteraceae bacterium]
MPRSFKFRSSRTPARMFETRSEAWAAVGLEVEINRHEAQRSLRRLPVELLALIGVVVGEQWVRNHIHDLAVFNYANRVAIHKGKLQAEHFAIGKTPVTIAAVLLVLALGWLISRDLAKVAPAIFRRMDPSTAGTVEFAIRFVSVAATVLGAFAVGGISLQAIAVGGGFAAVVFGLAAQQTLGNLFAGMVLLSARPFRLGERVRLQAGVLAGSLEGVVSSLGLLYTTLSRGEERMMIPNTIVLSATVMPLRDPNPVDVRVTLNSGVSLTHVQSILDTNISVDTRSAPSVVLEEIDGNSVVVRVKAIPERSSDGAKLADQVISALVSVTGEHARVDGGAPRS